MSDGEGPTGPTAGVRGRWVARYEPGPSLQHLLDETEDARASAVRHRAFGALRTLSDVRVFMEHHVFAVLDFMWLVKALQRSLTCVDVPWVPVGDAASRRFVNEIVLGEESDEVGDGWASHFELYLRAMDEVGCDRDPMDRFLDGLRRGEPVDAALAEAAPPESVRRFVAGTSAVAIAGEPHEVAAAFALGREHLIPEMFTSLLAVREANPGQLGLLVDYLERHVELDGDVHTPLALGLVEQLCGRDRRRWDEAEVAARRAIDARVGLWDGVLLGVGGSTGGDAVDPNGRLPRPAVTRPARPSGSAGT